MARVGDADFVRVPVDGSSKMPDAHMDAIEPFDYSDLKPFSTAYLPAFWQTGTTRTTRSVLPAS